MHSLKFFKKTLVISRERGREGEREKNSDVREKHQLVAFCMSPTGDMARNPGMFPERELNQRPFSSQPGAQSTEPHHLGPVPGFLNGLNFHDPRRLITTLYFLPHSIKRRGVIYPYTGQCHQPPDWCKLKKNGGGWVTSMQRTVAWQRTLK